MQGDGRPGTGGEPFERRLATILMADIVGYSRMMEANEERTLRVFRGHREIFDAMLVQHRGRMFNTAGDAVLAEFPSAVDAVRCATEIQSALRTRNDHLAPEERMQFRIGVNLGDVIVQGTDLLGDGVNVAARIQTAAEPGGVCVSGSVYDQIRNKLSLEFHSMGERTFKNITQPVRVFSIGDEAGEAAQAPATKASPSTPPTAPAAPRSRPVAAIAAVVAALAVAAAAGWWYVQDRETKAVEAARAAEATKAAEALAAAEAARRQAEEQAAARIASEREARLKAELEAAQREAAEAKKREAAARVAAAPSSRAAAPTASPPAASLPSAPPAAAQAAAPLPAAPPVQAKASYANDGLYRGRACWQQPGSEKGPQCWSLELAIDKHRIDASWVGTYGGGRPSSIRGQVSATGTVTALFEGFGAKGKSVMSELGGRADEGRLSFSGVLNNGARIDGSAIRVR
jgi:class 3 adenylate cyclase